MIRRSMAGAEQKLNRAQRRYRRMVAKQKRNGKPPQRTRRDVGRETLRAAEALRTLGISKAMITIPDKRAEKYVDGDGTVVQPICIRNNPFRAEFLVRLRTTAQTGKQLIITSRMQIGPSQLFKIDTSNLKRGVDYDTRGSGTMPSSAYVLGCGVEIAAHVLELSRNAQSHC